MRGEAPSTKDRGAGPGEEELREKLVECVEALERSAEREKGTRQFAADVSRDHSRWVRLFNRLDAALSRHRTAKQEGAFCDDADEALHAAHDRILKDAASSSGGIDQGEGTMKTETALEYEVCPECGRARDRKRGERHVPLCNHMETVPGVPMVLVDQGEGLTPEEAKALYDRLTTNEKVPSEHYPAFTHGVAKLRSIASGPGQGGGDA